MTPNKKKYLTLQFFGWLSCIGVPATVILTYFPLFVERGSTETMGATAIVLLLIAIIPFFKQIKQFFQKTPASWVIWVILFGLFLIVQTIVDQLVIVCGFGAVSNILGGVLFKISKKYQSPQQLLEESK